MGKLEELAREGFTDEAVAASLNTIEFNLRENNTGRFPRGLSLMLRSVASWLYEKDAFEPLRFSAPLEKLKQRIANKEDVWRPLLRQYLLANSHRVTLELQPDNRLGQQMEQEEREKCEQKKGGMSAKQIEELVEATRALKARDRKPLSPPRSSPDSLSPAQPLRTLSSPPPSLRAPLLFAPPLRRSAKRRRTRRRRCGASRRCR